MRKLFQTIRSFLPFLFAILAVPETAPLFAQKLLTYPPPRQILYTMHNDDYTVQVREPGGVWKDLYEYRVAVDMDRVEEASLVHFDFSGKVEVMIRKNNGVVNDVRVRPQSVGIKPQVKGNITRFTLNDAAKFSVEFNNDKHHNLHVFARSIDYARINKEDPNVIYFGPGLHKPAEGTNSFRIPSGKTVFLDGGAVVQGMFVVDSADNVTITGSGIVLEPDRGVEVKFSTNVTVQGIIFINPSHYTFLGGSSNGITIRDIMSFSCKGWSDGLDLMACSNVLIDRVFMRNSDDCIAIYGHRWNFYGNARNYQITNSTLWADIAHPTNIGTHGNATHAGDTIDNVVFRNIDILEHDEDDPNYQGCLAISATDKNLVNNIHYEDVRIDHIEEGQILNFRVYFNEKYSKAPGRRITNVTVKNVTYSGGPINASVISGYDAARNVESVTIQNLRVNGKAVVQAEPGLIEIGSFTDNVKFLR